MATLKERNLSIMHHGRTIITCELPMLDDKGEPVLGGNKRPKREKIKFGSIDDRETEEAIPNEVTMPESKWKRLLKQKAVAGMVQKRILTVHIAAEPEQAQAAA